MKTFLMHLVALGIAASALAQAPANNKDNKDNKDVTLTGTLRGGRIAIGGESTGWALEYRDASGPHSVEVDLPRDLLTRAKSGATVKLAGTYVTREYVERGAVRILRVTKLEEIAAPKPQR